MTTAIDEKIKALYENESLSPDVIAQEEGLSLVAVKSKLMQISSLYRKACGAESLEKDELNFSDSELREVNEIIMDTARAATTIDGQVDWKTRLDAAKYVRDDKKGRKEVRSIVAGNSFNILSINEQLSQVSDRTKKIKELVEV
jgi:hypothetical protein